MGMAIETGAAQDKRDLQVLVEADTHEVPVVVPSQNRLYYTTKPDFAADDTCIAVDYVDLETKEVGYSASASR